MAVGAPIDSNKTTTTIKFLCSYGGKILPRHPDGKLRYVGGETRVLAVNRSISYPEVLLKLGELCGSTSMVNLRCKLPTEDLDALVSIRSDEDLVNIIEEYDRASKASSSSLKIRAFLSSSSSSSKSIKKLSSPSSSAKSPNSDDSTGRYSFREEAGFRSRSHCCHHQISKPVQFPVYYEKPAAAGRYLHYYAPVPRGNPSPVYYLVHHK